MMVTNTKLVGMVLLTLLSLAFLVAFIGCSPNTMVASGDEVEPASLESEDRIVKILSDRDVKTRITNLPVGRNIEVVNNAGNGRMVAAGPSTLYVSSDTGKTWKDVREGRGYITSVFNGIPSNANSRAISSQLIEIGRMCQIQNSDVTHGGRFIAVTVCEHTVQIWSIPAFDLDSNWFVFEFIPNSSDQMSVFAPRPYLRVVGDRVLITGEFPDGSGLMESPDGGVTWQRFWTGPSTEVSTIDFDIVENGAVYILASDGILRLVTEAGSEGKLVSRVPTQMLESLRGIAFLNLSKGYLYGQGGRIFVTEDAGQNWKVFEVPTTSIWYKSIKTSHDVVWLSGSSGEVISIPRSHESATIYRFGSEHRIYFKLNKVDGSPAIVLKNELLVLKSTEKINDNNVGGQK